MRLTGHGPPDTGAVVAPPRAALERPSSEAASQKHTLTHARVHTHTHTHAHADTLKYC